MKFLSWSLAYLMIAYASGRKLFVRKGEYEFNSRFDFLEKR